MSSAPRRSARLAEKAAANKPAPPQKPLTLAELFPEFKTYVAKPITKPVAEPEEELEPDDESEESQEEPVQLISTYGADDDGYSTTGYALYRSKGMFEIICIDHCSCYETVEIVENYGDDFRECLENIISLATNKSDPRVPDIVTQDPHLLALYESILQHKDQLLTWVPSTNEEFARDDERLDVIEVHDPRLLHKR